MRIGSYLVRADQICDRIPVISTLSCSIDLVAKAVFQVLRSLNLNWFEGEYTAYLADKSKLRSILLMIPVLGNFLVWMKDRQLSKTDNFLRLNGHCLYDPKKDYTEFFEQYAEDLVKKEMPSLEAFLANLYKLFKTEDIAKIMERKERSFRGMTMKQVGEEMRRNMMQGAVSLPFNIIAVQIRTGSLSILASPITEGAKKEFGGERLAKCLLELPWLFSHIEVRGQKVCTMTSEAQKAFTEITEKAKKSNEY